MGRHQPTATPVPFDTVLDPLGGLVIESDERIEGVVLGFSELNSCTVLPQLSIGSFLGVKLKDVRHS